MAEITLDGVRHSYAPDRSEWALESISQVWEDGSANALLGPSGCGKTTLLNIISGLITPTEGRVLFNGEDVSRVDTIDRHIAQVFQFPVIYDTMTVADNLAFPLRNRDVPEDAVRRRVGEVARLLDLEGILADRARGLSAADKQKISLGRGLVREDVNAIMFDEPLTVIDPHLKWQLRSKLKQIHQQVGVTMIYVTHDQTEALTFADRVIVLSEGTVVQVGTPEDLFLRPHHTFVGHFIGSPGMNIFPCEVEDGRAVVAGHAHAFANGAADGKGGGRLELGVRPEFVRFAADGGMPVDVERVDDLGRHKLVRASREGHSIKMIVPEQDEVPSEGARIAFDPANTWLYDDGWLAK